MTGEEVRSEIHKKDRLIEDLQRSLDDLKQQVIKRDRKVEACKETIKRLLIQQSKMERKQVLCFVKFSAFFDNQDSVIFSSLFFIFFFGETYHTCSSL